MSIYARVCLCVCVFGCVFSFFPFCVSSFEKKPHERKSGSQESQKEKKKKKSLSEQQDGLGDAAS